MLPVIWRPAADNQLLEIARFIADHDEVAAVQIVERIEAVALLLSQHPYLGRAGRAAGTREVLAHPNYWLIYRVKADAVEVLSVLHARQQYP